MQSLGVALRYMLQKHRMGILPDVCVKSSST